MIIYLIFVYFQFQTAVLEDSRGYRVYTLKSEKPTDCCEGCEEENHRWSRDASKVEPPTR